MKEIKNSNKGFTLLELLIVVLIIGILAAIALPQYRMAVAKSKFNILKGMTKSLAESSQRYYLTNGMYPQKIEDLDISFSGAQITYSDTAMFSFSTPEGITCSLWKQGDDTSCSRKIFDKVAFYIRRDTNKPRYCLAYSKDESNISNRLCQKETGMKNGACSYEKYCAYLY